MFGAGYLVQMLRDSQRSSGSEEKITDQSDSGKTERKEQSGDWNESTISVRVSDDAEIIDSSTSAVQNEDIPVERNDLELLTELKQCEVSSNENSLLPTKADDIPGSEELEKILLTEECEAGVSMEELEPEKTEVGTSRIEFDFNTTPVLLLRESSAFDSLESPNNLHRNNYLKGCKWSPDGSCILTNSEDRILRIFTLPSDYYDQQFYTRIARGEARNDDRSMNVLSSMSAGDLVYDYCWYPLMNSYVPESCVYIQTARDHPIQLCDAVSGQVCATYLPINHLDEVSSGHSVAFSHDGAKLYAGFNKTIRIFDTHRPGRQLSTVSTWKKRLGGQAGIISCIAVCPTTPGLYACGSYGKTIATYSSEFGDGFLSLMHVEDTGGITHLVYHPNGNYLYSGGRMDEKIMCWDMRVPGRIFACYQREASTNQRFHFDLDRSGRYLVSGTDKGEVKVWDTTKTPDDNVFVDPIVTFQAHSSSANGASFNPYLPLLVTGSGQRVFPSPEMNDLELGSSDTEEDESFGNDDQLDNSVKLWLVGRFDT